MIQLQFINYLITSKDPSLIVMNNLTEEYFSDYKQEFNYINLHYTKYGNVPDAETFFSTFPETEVVQVKETPQYLIDTLLKDYKTRKLAGVFMQIKSLLERGKVEEATVLYQTEAENFTVGVSLQSVDILQDISRYEAYLERTQDFSKFYITTGFKEIDAVVGGWDRQEELATIVARTNKGKSWILLKSAVASAQQGLRVGIYSGEMSERKVGYRADTLIGGISNSSLSHGNISIQLEYKEYIEKLPTMLKGTLKVLTPLMINGPADVNALRMFIEKDELDILFIDQLSLLEDQRKARNPVEKASNISRDLKNLQVMKRIPIISVSQQNRTKNEEGGVDTTQIAQSDRIGQDSTCILFLERDDDIMKIHLVKSRDSATGKIFNYKTDLNTGKFIYIPEDEDDDITDGEYLDDYDDFNDDYRVNITEREEIF